ncbi:MAG TPA: hypothetical protein VLQ93_26085, partial [Myxococcaceae bacterium]|nr:hypothetical protein [Myxococcaceae bacterium]
MWAQRYRAWLRGETAQPLRPLLEWLGRCPLLLVLQALPVVIVWGGFSALGLPGLFFHDVPRVTFVAAFMAAMLLGQLCFIGYLLDADEPWALAARPGKPGGVSPSIRWYLFRTGTYPAWLLALSLPSLIDRHFVFLFGVLAAVGVMVLLTHGAEWLQQRYTANRQRHRWVRRIEVTFFRRRPTHLVALHVLQAWLLGLFALGYVVVAAYVAWRGRQGWVSPAVVICVAVGMLGAVYGAIRFFFPQRHMGALIAVAVGVVFGGRGCADASVYEELSLEEPPAYAGASLVTPAEAGLLDDEAVLAAWLEGMRQRPPPGAAWRLEGTTELVGGAGPARCSPGPKPRLALVATSGGGIRAAAWTAHVLSRLEGGVAGFHRYVRLMTGASG